ncbi:MAG: DUF1792 domain-containing protein [Lachnospiraceae bacterium]|nr:DUF1792 domain-containing protein [Lachnospiraceae bacterium]
MSIKEYAKQRLADLVFSLYRTGILKMKHEIRVMTIDETIDELLDTKKSLVRFGDGEIAMMRGVSLTLQKEVPELTGRLKEILTFPDDDLLVAVQEIFTDLNDFIPKSQRFWKDHLLVCRKYYERYCNPDRIYRSARFSRCYATVADRSRCRERFDRIAQIWRDQDVVVVEGEESRTGEGNDLLDQARSVEKILGPARNAYDEYDRILADCRKKPKDRLFLLALGPCAKPLAEDLFRAGYRVIDIGNLNNEYNWFLAGVTDKDNAKPETVPQSDQK